MCVPYPKQHRAFSHMCCFTNGPKALHVHKEKHEESPEPYLFMRKQKEKHEESPEPYFFIRKHKEQHEGSPEPYCFIRTHKEQHEESPEPYLFIRKHARRARSLWYTLACAHDV